MNELVSGVHSSFLEGLDTGLRWAVCCYPLLVRPTIVATCTPRVVHSVLASVRVCVNEVSPGHTEKSITVKYL